MILVIVDPGCEAKGQDDIEHLARNLLYPYSSSYLHAQGGPHHHARGYAWTAGHFECTRGIWPFDDDDLPTVHPLAHPPSFPDGNTCLGCNGTGRVPFACAENICPLCGGAGVQLDNDIEPGIFPLSLMRPDLIPWAIVTPDGRMHCCETADGPRPDWEREAQELAAYFRHCYGVCLQVK